MQAMMGGGPTPQAAPPTAGDTAAAPGMFFMPQGFDPAQLAQAQQAQAQVVQAQQAQAAATATANNMKEEV